MEKGVGVGFLGQPVLSMGYWEGKTATFGKSGFLVVVSVPLVHPEYWFLVLSPQVQEIWHPVFQLLAGS